MGGPAGVGAAVLADAMIRAGRPGHEIARAVVVAREYGLIEAVISGAVPEDSEEIRHNYVYRNPARVRDAAELERQRREADRQWSYNPGPPVKQSDWRQPHGTPARLRRHYREKDPPCAECKAFERRRSAEQEARKRRRGPSRVGSSAVISNGMALKLEPLPLPGGPAGRGQDGFRALPSGSGSTPTGARRCRKCHYLIGSVGHEVQCGAG